MTLAVRLYGSAAATCSPNYFALCLFSTFWIFTYHVFLVMQEFDFTVNRQMHLWR